MQDGRLLGIRGWPAMRLVVLVGAGAVLCPSPAAAHTLHVPAQYATIQHALYVASAGDTILVAPGDYYEDIVWPARQSLHLISEAGPEVTSINGMGAGSVIRFPAAVDATTLIEGFTITNGNAEMGGGIACPASAPTIRGNRIVENTATYYGGGIYCGGEGLAPVIHGNSFRGNTVADGSGGGICCYGDTYAVIRDNEFRDNAADAYFGGAIHCEVNLTVGATLIIEHNIFMNNTARGGGALSFFNPYPEPPQVRGNEIAANTAEYGGGIYANWTLADVRGNSIHDNHASATGGGIFAEESHDLAVIDCDITGNSAGAQGGGLALVAWTTTPVVTGNTITRNTAANGAGIYCYYMSSPTIRSNQINDNEALGRGGAIFCETECTPAIDLNVVMGNRALIGGGLYMMDSQPTITQCMLAENDAGAMHFTLGWPGHSPQVHENSIAGNGGYGARNDDAAVPVAAENNWWGDPSGPYHPTQNPGGLGDPVGDNVVFVPWLLDPGVVAAVGGSETGGGSQPGRDPDARPIATSGLQLTCSPNPFSATTTISCHVPGGLDPSAPARVAIYDVAGRLVRRFPIQGSSAGGAGFEGRFVWEGEDESGVRLPAGVHYVRLEAGGLRLGARVIRMR
jgi:parallel beta-helix repeat protein